MLKDNEYECACCGEVFEFVLTEKEAIEQLKREFPGTEKKDCDIVCNGCFEEIKKQGFFYAQPH
jgi:Fe2+ or Zn2+ uptake regulation protein